MSDNEIKQISKTEYTLGKNNISLIEDNIVYVVAVGEQTFELALKYKQICAALESLVDGKVNYLINLDKCGKNAPEARKVWKEISEYENTHKVVTFGMHPVARVIASFYMSTQTNSNVTFLKSKEDGIKWLKS